MVKNVKKIMRGLCCLIFCTAVAVGMPQMAKAAEVAIDATNFPDEIFRNDITNWFDTDKNGKLSEDEIKEVTEIDVYESGIGSLKGIEYFTNLTYLNCFNNELTSLDVSKNVNLTSLSCHNNKLTSLDVTKNIDLVYLSCDGNKLTTLNISKNTDLKGLDCSNNELTNIDVTKNTDLERLYCGDNDLTTLNVTKNTNLERLYCSSNKITTLNLNKNSYLTTLECSSNDLTTLDVSKNTYLKYLWCRRNKLTSLNLNKNTDLKSLDCSWNKLAALDLSKNINLKKMSCCENKLVSLDLSNNKDLECLWCAYNSLTLTELKLHSETYDKLHLFKGCLHSEDASLSDLQNVTEIDYYRVWNNDYDYDDDGIEIYYYGEIIYDYGYYDDGYVSLIEITDITEPATYKVDGKDFTITYVDTATSPSPSSSPITPVTPSDARIFSDYNCSNPVTDSAIIYGNGINKKVNGTRVNNKAFTAFTDILASYKHMPNSNGTVKSTVGKVIVGVTKTADKPTVSSKNKITDTSATNIAKAKIKNGQITVTSVGKEGGLVYLWVIDTGSKGVSAYCPIDVKLAPKKIEVQSTTGTKLTNPKIQNGTTLDVHVTGLAGSVKTEDCTYTPAVDSKFQQYVQIAPKGTTGQDFTITAKGLKNDKDTKAVITFTCDQNGKKVKFSLTVTK